MKNIRHYKTGIMYNLPAVQVAQPRSAVQLIAVVATQ